jgi:CemA family
MALTPYNKKDNPLSKAWQWLGKTPDRAIEKAYQAAQGIKRIEDQFFDGAPITDTGAYQGTSASVFLIQLQKYLRVIDVQLAAYRVSATLPTLLPQGNLTADDAGISPEMLEFAEKLKFIDTVVLRYRGDAVDNNPAGVPSASETSSSVVPLDPAGELLDSEPDNRRNLPRMINEVNKSANVRRQKGNAQRRILPGSFFNAFDYIKNNIGNPDNVYEQDVIGEMREMRRRTNNALKYLILIIVVVVSTQLISKNLIYGPVINRLADSEKLEQRFSPSLQEKALRSFRDAKERLELERLLMTIAPTIEEKAGETKSAEKEAVKGSEKPAEKPSEKGAEKSDSKPEGKSETKSENKSEGKSETKTEPKAETNAKPSAKEIEEIFEAKLQQETIKILRRYNEESIDGVKNLLADITATFAAYVMIITGQRQLRDLKAFIDEVLFNLNDNAKAFLIIVSTDTFVGFHSSEGWDALITVLFDHFGLPENKILTMTFISTVPVFLDGLFKFWIFQYLSQASPATATIYREMNE